MLQRILSYKISNLPIKRVALCATLFLFVLFLGIIIWLISYEYQKGPQLPQQKATVIIPRGANVRTINSLLGEAGLIHSDIRFVILTRIKKVSAKLPAGEFSLTTGQTPTKVIDELVGAKPIRHVITIPEGLRIEEIAKIFSDKGWCKEEEYIQLAKDPELIKDLGFNNIESLEGYLFPDTYHRTRDYFDARKIIHMQVKRFYQVWKGFEQTKPSESNIIETVILASMIEKEAGVREEMVQISAVFHNRLQKGMKLQSDPTVSYGIEGFKAPITKTHLRTNTPYNTYVIPGLPAGPIANPGEAALYASLFPVKSKYLYFVSKNDGTHKFSTNLKDHNRAVRKYQRKKNNKNGKE